MKVEVVRSPRRRKTVQAKVVGGVIRVYVPASMSRRDELRWVDEMVRRLDRRTSAAEVDIAARAGALSRRLGLERPASIRWVDNQEMRWGSCTPADRTIRISSRLAREPAWVLDYVIVHELAHLTVPGHGPSFWALVDRYRLAERARGFLMARGMDEAVLDEPDVVADELEAANPATDGRSWPEAGRGRAVAAHERGYGRRDDLPPAGSARRGAGR